MLLAVSLAALLPGCATHDADAAFDDSFDSTWMSVVPVDRAALSGYCLREDRQNLLGCARPYQDSRGARDPEAESGANAAPAGDATGAAGGGEQRRTGVRGTCVIYVARDLVRDTASFDYVLRHEAKHCRGWRHPGD